MSAFAFQRVPVPLPVPLPPFPPGFVHPGPSPNINRASIKLADDIICILYYLLADLDPPSVREKYITGSLGWIRLTHVSRQWRRVGIDLAPLWARIACVFPPDVKTIVQRAKDIPLEVDMRSAGSVRHLWKSDEMQALPVTRCRTYKDHCYNKETSNWYKIFAGRTFPALEELELRSMEMFGDPEGEFEAMDAPVLHKLMISIPFAINAPSLRSLNCASGEFWDWRVLLSVLKTCPMLEKLVVGQVKLGMKIWGRTTEDAQRAANVLLERALPPTIVHLPHLKELEMGEYNSEAQALVEHLDLPACTLFKARTDEDDECWAQILSLPVMTRPPRRALSITEEFDIDFESYTWELSLTENEVLIPPTYAAPGACGTIHISLEPSHIHNLLSNSAPNLLNAVSHATAAAIQELAIVHACSADWACDCPPQLASRTRWTAALARFSGVTTLHFTRLLRDVFVSPKAKPDTLFPLLHTVIFTADGPVGETESSVWTSLYAMLGARERAGRPLARLIVRGNALCHTACPGGHRDSQKAVEECLKQRRITLEGERRLVSELVDERQLDQCSCAKGCNNDRSRDDDYDEDEDMDDFHDHDMDEDENEDEDEEDEDDFY